MIAADIFLTPSRRRKDYGSLNTSDRNTDGTEDVIMSTLEEVFDLRHSTHFMSWIVRPPSGSVPRPMNTTAK
jgi:hypothetical protein